MSINNIANTVFPNTLSGLDALNVTDITINGVDVTSLFVPYTGANANIDLNNKNLSGVNSITTTSVVASGTVQGQNLTATGLTTTNTLKINSVPAGTVAKALAVDSAGNVIEGSVVPTQISVTDITVGYASPMYFPYVIINSAGSRTIYVDTDSPITYNTNSKTLTIKNLSASSGNWNNTGTTYSATLQGSVLSITGSATFPQFCNFSTTPNVGTPAYFLAVNAVNEVVVATGISAQPTITAINNNATYYLTFAPNATTTASSPLYVDSTASLTYNAFNNTLTVPIAEIPTSLTANGSFTANGSNSIAGYAPLNSPAFSGIPTSTTGLAGTSSTQIATQEFVIDSLPNLGLYMTKTGTNAGVNTVFQFGPTLTDSFEIKRNDGVSLMKLVQNSSQTMTIYNLLMTGVLQAYIFSTSGSAYLGTTLQVVGNTTLSTATGVTPAAGNNSTALATTAYVQSEIGNFITKTGVNTGINNILRLSGTSSEFVVQSSTSNPLLSVRQSASPYVSADSLYVITTLETAGNTTVGGNLDVTNALTATTGSMEVKSNVILMRNVNYPHLFLGAGAGSAGNLIGQATGAGNFLNDSGVGDLCINSRTGNIRIAGGAQYGRTNTLITNNGVGNQAGSMFDFTAVTAGGWTDSNSLYMTANGMGGNTAGVGIGHNTTLDSGLLCSIAPNVVWKRMTYKANDHLFTVAGNTSMVTINTVGLNLATAGYLTNYQGALNAGLSNVNAGDLVLYAAGSTQAIKIYTGANLTMITNNTRVEVKNVEHVVTGNVLGQYRMINNTAGVGAMWRNDDANFYFLKTNYGDPYGIWDGTRPFYIDLVSGKVNSNNGFRSLGGFECDTFTGGVNNGSHVALNGGNYFIMVGSGNQATGCYLPQGFNMYKVYISTTGNQFGTNDQWWAEAVVRYNNNSYNCSVTTTASNNIQVSGDANGHIYCYCPGGSGLYNAWITWQRVI